MTSTTYVLDADTWSRELQKPIGPERFHFARLEAALDELYRRRFNGQRAMLTAVVETSQSGNVEIVTLLMFTDHYPRPDAIADLVRAQGGAS